MSQVARRPAEPLEPRRLLSGYNLNTAASFVPSPNGAGPDGLAIDASGNLFGFTAGGGTASAGTLFEVPRGATTQTVLSSLPGTGGVVAAVGPLAVDSAGNIYGATDTTSDGTSTAVAGTVVKVATSTHAVTRLASLPASLVGDDQTGLTLGGDGLLYGATYHSVFSVSPSTGAVAVLATQSGSASAGPSSSPVRDSAGNLFLTSYYGGSAGDGAILEVAAGSTAITTLYSFTDGSTGEYPTGNLAVDSAGNLYGAAGPVLFEVPATNRTVVKLAAVPAGQYNDGPLTADAAGDLFGATSAFYELPHGATAVQTLASLPAGVRQNGDVPLARDAAGDLFGDDATGGAGGRGSVYDLPAGKTAATTVATFAGTQGATPAGGLTADAAGDLFGTTTAGGSADDGSVFELPHGSATPVTLASFLTADAFPTGSVAVDAVGDVFGATEFGSPGGLGTLFEVVHGSGTVTTLATLTYATGVSPTGGVALDAAGDLFAAPSGYFPNQYPPQDGDGTIVELPHGSASLRVLYTFTGPDGQEPAGGLTLDPAGDLFGDTEYGGPNGTGIVFELQAGASTLTTLHAFAPSGDGRPDGGLFRDAAGDLFGTVQASPPYGGPAIFELTPSPAPTTYAYAVIGTFSGNASPDSPLAADAAGDLFGSSYAGSSGTSVFELPRGSSAVQSVTGTLYDAIPPQSDLSVDSAGDVFGLLEDRGSADAGSVFELTVPTHLAFVGGATSVVAGRVASTPVTVDVDDAFGNPVAGESSTVQLAVKSGPSGGGLVGTTTAIGYNGVATFPTLAFTTAGTYTLTAVDGAYAAGTSAAYTVTAAPATTVATTAGDGQTADAGASFAAPLSVKVTVNGVAAAGVVVTFAAPTSGPTVSPASAAVTTDANGVASLTVTAGYTGGAATVTAAVVGTAAAATFHLNVFVLIPLTLTGPAFYLRRDADGTHLDIWDGTTPTGSPAQQVVYANYSSGTITGTGTAATLTLDYSNGTPLVAGEEAFAGTGAGSTLTVVGRAAGDTVDAFASGSGQEVLIDSDEVNQTNVGGGVVYVPGAGTSSVYAGSGPFALQAPAGATGVTTRLFSDIVVGYGVRLAVATPPSAGAKLLLVVSNLSIAGPQGAYAATLDLGTNDMVVQQATAGYVPSYAAAGAAGGLFDGPGLTSSAAAADPRRLAAVGYALNVDPDGQPLYGSGTALGLFDGYSPATTDVLVRYTVFGDANLDGKVDGADYVRIDAGAAAALTGWDNGDFNYDGRLNASDYTLIDNAFNGQPARQTGAVAVPAAARTTPAAIPTSADYDDGRRRRR